jgi:uncharacterized membrane protein YiaA
MYLNICSQSSLISFILISIGIFRVLIEVWNAFFRRIHY